MKRATVKSINWRAFGWIFLGWVLTVPVSMVEELTHIAVEVADRIALRDRLQALLLGV